MIRIELSERGISHILVKRSSTEQVAKAHRLLARVSGEIKALHEAIVTKKSETKEWLQEHLQEGK